MGLLRASAGKVDLTPSAGDWMTGFAVRINPATGIHDPIMARAILLSDGDKSVAIVSCDTLGFTPAIDADMRSTIAGKSNIAKNDIIICSTHTHSGPASLPMRGIMGRMNAKWLQDAQQKIVDLVIGLQPELQPAKIAQASTVVSGIGFNRQDNQRPIDEELVAISVESDTGDVIATIANYAAHAVTLGPKNLEFSADFPGATARRLEQLRGGIGIFLQGACGDVNPILGDSGFGAQGFTAIEEIGKNISEAAARALEKAERTSEVTLRTAVIVIGVPLELPPVIEDVEQLIDQSQAQVDQARRDNNTEIELWELSMLEWENELKQAAISNTSPKWVPAKIIAIGIGDIMLISTPLEAYADIGMRIKEGLKPLKTAFVGYANGLYGYCPSTWAYEQGGYGPGDSHRWFPQLLTPIACGADDIIVSECIKLGKTLID